MDGSIDDRRRRLPERVFAGQGEAIFGVLPETVVENFLRSSSENALLWNLFYPRLHPSLNFADLIGLPPIWGTALRPDEDEMRGYFWGFGVSGERLEGLDDVLTEVDGPGSQTEVDLILLGSKNLVLIEAKNNSDFGRCSRYGRSRCPEIHPGGRRADGPCRYWGSSLSRFDRWLEFGARPQRGDPSPPCNRHYQLARTLLVGQALAAKKGLALHLWLVIPQYQWRRHKGAWLDFTDRLQDEGLWRRCRVLGWEELRRLPTK